MTTLTGSLADPGFDRFAGQDPVLLFSLSEVSTHTGTVLTRGPVRVKPASSGDWAVELADTDAMPEGSHYRLAIEVGGGSARERYELAREIFLPPGAWTLDGLPSTPLSPAFVWVNETPPTDRARWWLDTTTGELKMWS
ncbi:MAG: hypothetical protein ACTH31_02685 [Pseudoclavibacter sp.]